MKHLVFVLLLSAVTVASAQTSFEETGKKFKEAVSKDDMNTIADLMAFPFSSNNWGSYISAGTSGFGTREDFLKVSKQIFTKKVKQAIAKSDFKKVQDAELAGKFYYRMVFSPAKQKAVWILFDLQEGEWKAVGADSMIQ